MKGWARGWALESIAARICREGGGRVTTNVLVRDLDLALPGAVADGKRLEVVVDGLPLFGGAQLAVDTTLVCALRSDGRPTRAAVEDGAKVTRTRQRGELVGACGGVGWKWVAGSPRRRNPSCRNCPEPRPVVRTPS